MTSSAAADLVVPQERVEQQLPQEIVGPSELLESTREGEQYPSSIQINKKRKGSITKDSIRSTKTSRISTIDYSRITPPPSTTTTPPSRQDVNNPSQIPQISKSDPNYRTKQNI